MNYLPELRHIGDEGWLELALSSTRKDNVEDLRFIKKDIEKRYKNFEKEVINIHIKPADTNFPCSEDQELITNYYSYPPKKLEEKVKERRNGHRLKDCPYCGLPLKPLTLDHFIPKSTWPDYAIYPNNLVPQCRRCAPIKGNKYFCDKEKICYFISPIYSDLLSKITLNIGVEFDIKSKKYDFNIIFQIDNDVNNEKRIIKHISSLKIKSRIMYYCIETMQSWIFDCSSSNFDIRLVLGARKTEREKIDKNVSDWQTALYLGMLKNEELLKYLESLQPIKKSKIKTKKRVLDI